MTNTILPKGWEWKTLGEVVKYKKGKKPKMLSDTKFEGSVPYLDIRTLEHGNVFQYADVKSSNILKETDLAVVWDGARAGWVSKGKNGAMGSTIMGLEYLYNCPNYLFYFLKCQFEIINSNPRGTGIPHVDPSIFWHLKIPIPPLAEQQRIAARLDEMMEAVENAKKRIGQIPEKMKQFRQAVLAQAVSGRLTEDWRDGEWEFSTIGEVLIELNAGKSFQCEERPPLENEIGVLKVSAVSWGSFNQEESKTCFDKEKVNSNYLVNKGDFLMSRANTLELVGAVVIVNDISKKLMLSDKTLRLKFSNNINTIWMLYFMRSREGRNQIEEFSTGAQLSMRNISQNSIKSIKIPLPPLAEQQEIVRRVETLFEYADGIEAKYAALKEKMEQLPQAILAKAFRGEL